MPNLDWASFFLGMVAYVLLKYAMMMLMTRRSAAHG